MGFGVNYILSRQRYNASPGLKIPNLRLFLNGFAVNLMNPSVVLFWLGTMALTLSKFKLNGRETLVYYTTTLGVMASIDVLKAYFAYKISKFISVRILRMIYIISGILMIGIGIYFVMK
jgi:L-lysine exporter family protein LysE/ArgO